MTRNDLAILELLQEDSRLTHEDISEQLNMEPSEVKKAIEKMQRDGVIRGYTIIIDDNMLLADSGKVKALVEVRVRPEKNTGFSSLAKRLSRHKNVVEHYLISGSYDFLLVVIGNNIQEISSFVAQKLACLENVMSTKTHFIMKKYKEKGVLIKDDQETERLVVS